MKDNRPLAPIGSSTDDKLFNGLSFDFAVLGAKTVYWKGQMTKDRKEVFTNEEIPCL